MSYNRLISRVLILGFALCAGFVFYPPNAAAQIVPVSTATPIVFPPPDLVVGITETGGARGSGDPRLAAFLVGAKAKAEFDPNPVALLPQVNGVNADNTTFFPEGTTVVTFSFRDAAEV